MKPNIENSPFQDMHLANAEELYSEPGSRFGIMDKNGDIYLDFNNNTSYSFLAQFAQVTGTKVVMVKGTWTFDPDNDSITIIEKKGTNQ